MTLVELLVSVAIGTIVSSAVLGVSLYSSRSLASISNYLEMEGQTRQSLDLLTRDVRSATAITGISSNWFSARLPDNSILTYEYFPSSRTLKRNSAGTWTKILTECDALQFVLYRLPTNGAPYNTFTLASGTNGHVLAVNWTCSRTLAGSRLNTESCQSARIVIRNAP